MEVMTLLLRADHDAPGKVDNVRRCTHTPSRMHARCYPNHRDCALRTAPSHAEQEAAATPRRDERRAARCDEAAARRQLRGRRRSRPGARFCTYCAARAAPCVPPLSPTPKRNRPARPMLRRMPRHVQDDRMPLHYAAEKGASLDVMGLLLGAKREAAAAADKARSSRQMPHCPRRRSSSACPLFSLPPSSFQSTRNTQSLRLAPRL